MRIGWHVHLLGAIGMGGTLWRCKGRRRKTRAAGDRWLRARTRRKRCRRCGTA